jgi:hypothetical protein
MLDHKLACQKHKKLQGQDGLIDLLQAESGSLPLIMK